MGSQIQCPLWSNHCHSESISRPYFVQNAEELFFELIRTFYIQNSQAPCYCGAFQVWCNPLLDYIAYRHMNRLTIGSDCPVGLWIGSSGPLLSPLLLQQPCVAGFLFGGAYSLQNYFRKPSRLAEFFVHCCGRLSCSYIVAKLMHLRNRDFSSCEGMLLEPTFIRRLLGVWMLLGWLLSSRELAALDDNFLGRSTVRFVVQLMYSASTAKGSGV